MLYNSGIVDIGKGRKIKSRTCCLSISFNDNETESFGKHNAAAPVSYMSCDLSIKTAFIETHISMAEVGIHRLLFWPHYVDTWPESKSVDVNPDVNPSQHTVSAKTKISSALSLHRRNCRNIPNFLSSQDYR